MFRRALTFSACLAVFYAGSARAQAPSLAVPPDRAMLLVRVPADAALTVGADATAQRGAERYFLTPPLQPGNTYAYEVAAKWTENGRPRKAAREVRFHAGQLNVVDLTAAQTEPAPPAGPSTEQPKQPKTRSFLFTYAGKVTDLPPGKETQVWLPLAMSDTHQQVEIVNQQLPAEPQTGKDATYGNPMLSFQAKANEKGEVPFSIQYKVTRREVQTSRQGNLYLSPSAEEKVTRYLQPDAKVPIAGKPLELLQDRTLPGDQFAAAKVMYDVVNEYMTYKKEGTGWGRGDVLWACDSKYGNCTDFHSLFISMSRGNKIPSKFEMGFPIPEKRGAGPVGGYHCWAWFLPAGKGWIPVDISEANRNPKLSEYYFGNLTEDRVKFTTGRDIDLAPRQKGPALNFFIYPYVEVDGQPYAADKVQRAFAYEDVK